MGISWVYLREQETALMFSRFADAVRVQRGLFFWSQNVLFYNKRPRVWLPRTSFCDAGSMWGRGSFPHDETTSRASSWWLHCAPFRWHGLCQASGIRIGPICHIYIKMQCSNTFCHYDRNYALLCIHSTSNQFYLVRNVWNWFLRHLRSCIEKE